MYMAVRAMHRGTLSLARMRALSTNATASASATAKPWTLRMADDRVDLLSRIVAAPTPTNLEGAMTFGVIEPAIKAVAPSDWSFHRLVGSASLVVKTPARPLSIMVVGHADKIRLQVRSVDKASGKIYVDSDSHLPMTLLSSDVSIYSESTEALGSFHRIRGTVEALGAIHFADGKLRDGSKGVGPDMLYVDVGAHGSNAGARVEALGIKPGDSILMDRPLRRMVADDVVSAPYLDNGIGCFVVTELARLLAEPGTRRDALANVQVMLAIAAHEEIGRFGSRVLASVFKPDILIAVDVNHDYANAPGVSSKKFTPLSMGAGFTISVGSVTSRKVNELLQRAAKAAQIPYQLDVVGRDTGTDAMAGVLGAVDCAAASVGIPTRNMHTASEMASTRDIDAALHGVLEFIKLASEQCVTRHSLEQAHANLAVAKELAVMPPAPVAAVSVVNVK